MSKRHPPAAKHANQTPSPRHAGAGRHPRLSLIIGLTLCLPAFLAIIAPAYASDKLCDQLNYLANQTGPMLKNVQHAPLHAPPPDPDPNVVTDPWLYGKSTFTFGGGYICTFRQLGTTALVHLECDLSPGAKGITGKMDNCMAKFPNWHSFDEGPVNDQIYFDSYSLTDLSETITIMSRPDGVLTLIDIVAHNP